MSKRFIGVVSVLFMILAMPSILDVSKAFAYTDEEINEAISDLSARISAIKESDDKFATVSGRMYIGYVNDMMKESRKNYFEISRVYLDFKKSLDKNVAVRVTTDIERFATTEADTRYNVYLKYAYFDLNNLGVPYIGLNTVRVGMSATHWIDFMQNYWTFRYLSKTLTDHFKVLDSADLGIAALGAVDLSGLGVPYIGRFDYHATYMNGQGYKKDESSINNYGKTVAIKIGTEPVMWGEKDKLTTAVGYQVKEYPVEVSNAVRYDGLENVATGMIAWNFSWPGAGILFTEGYAKHTGGNNNGKYETGASFGGQYEVVPNVIALARLDQVDPSYWVKEDEKTYQVIGMEYDWGSNVRLAFDVQQEISAAHKLDKSTWNLHSEVKW